MTLQPLWEPLAWVGLWWWAKKLGLDLLLHRQPISALPAALGCLRQRHGGMSVCAKGGMPVS